MKPTNGGGVKPPIGRLRLVLFVHFRLARFSNGEVVKTFRLPIGFSPLETGGEDLDFSCGMVLCKNCAHWREVMATIRMPAADIDKIIRVNHPGNRWLFPLVEVRAGWASVRYPTHECYGGEPAPMPIDVKHRCHYFNDKSEFNNESNQKENKEWWE